MTTPATSSSRLRLVVDPDDSVEHHRFFSELHCLEQGRCVAHLRAGSQNWMWLASSVLEALGKEFTRRGNSLDRQESRRRVTVWLKAHRVKELFALRAQYLDKRGWRDLCALAADVDCDLTVVVSGTDWDRRRQRIAEEWPFDRLSYSEWMRAHGQKCAKSAKPPAKTDFAFPEVPRTEFALFRAACRDLPTEADFRAVDARFFDARIECAAWLFDEDVQESLDEEAVAKHVREQVAKTKSFSEALTVVRAIQVAVFAAGFLLKVNVDHFSASIAREPLDLATPASAELLQEFVLAKVSAAATVALVGRAQPAEVAAVRMADVAADGSELKVRGTRVMVPSPFQAFIRAQRLERLLDGAADDDGFITAWRADPTRNPEDERAIQRMLREAATYTGLPVATDATSRVVDPSQHRWAKRRGVSVKAIGALADVASCP